MRKAVAIFALALTLLFAGSVYAEDTSSKGSRLNAGDSVEYFGLKPLITEKNLATFVNISDIVGPNAKQPSKLLLISFFASWCQSCKRELPQIENYYRRYKDKGLTALYICIDTDNEGADKSREFIRTNQLSAQVLHDSYNIVARRYFKD